MVKHVILTDYDGYELVDPKNAGLGMRPKYNYSVACTGKKLTRETLHNLLEKDYVCFDTRGVLNTSEELLKAFSKEQSVCSCCMGKLRLLKSSRYFKP